MDFHRLLAEHLSIALLRPSGELQPAVHIEFAKLQLLIGESLLTPASLCMIRFFSHRYSFVKE